MVTMIIFTVFGFLFGSMVDLDMPVSTRIAFSFIFGAIGLSVGYTIATIIPSVYDKVIHKDYLLYGEDSVILAHLRSGRPDGHVDPVYKITYLGMDGDKEEMFIGDVDSVRLADGGEAPHMFTTVDKVRARCFRNLFTRDTLKTEYILHCSRDEVKEMVL